MKLFEIYRFDEGPHWNVALVHADDADAARQVLADKLEKNEYETVWQPRPQNTWDVAEVPEDRDVVLVLGSGCR